jgi:hypothetical protein
VWDLACVVVAAAAVAFVEGILVVVVVVVVVAAAAVAVVVEEEAALFAVAVVIRMDAGGIHQGVDVDRDSVVVVAVGAADRVVVGVVVVAVEVVVRRVQGRHRVERRARVVGALVREGSSLLL